MIFLNTKEEVSNFLWHIIGFSLGFLFIHFIVASVSIMRKPQFQKNWPLLWKESYEYDCLEQFGSKENPGYRYAYHQRFEQVVESVLEFLPKGSSLLDIAAAQGNFTLTLAEQGYNMTWNDLREDLMGYVRLKYDYGSIDYYAGNAFEIPAKHLYDGVIITEIIEHVAHPDEFLKKVASLVKVGGYIFMTTPLGNYWLNKLPRFSDCTDTTSYESMQFKPNSDGHIFLLHKDEIISLADRCGLTIKRLSIYNNTLTSGHFKTHILLRFLPFGMIHILEKMSQRLPEVFKLKIHCNVAVVFEKK